MPDLLSIVFERSDRYPSSEEYGPEIDRRLQRMVADRTQLAHHTVGSPRVEIRDFKVQLEIHETGPIFLFPPERLGQLTPFFAVVREMAREWVLRDTGGSPIFDAPKMSIRYGPYEPERSDASWQWRRMKITTDPLTAADRLDELIAAVLGEAGTLPARRDGGQRHGPDGDPRRRLLYEQALRGVDRQAGVVDECRGRAATLFAAASIAAGFLGAEAFTPPQAPGPWAWIGAGMFALSGCVLQGQSAQDRRSCSNARRHGGHRR